MAQSAENTQPIGARIEASAHSSDSSLREQALGHVFLGQLLTFMWRSGAHDIEVLKSEVARGLPSVALRQGLLSGGRIPRISGISALTAGGRESATVNLIPNSNYPKTGY
jgi:hypothetical protein